MVVEESIKREKVKKKVFIKRRGIIKGKIEPFLYMIPSLMIFTLFVFYPFIKTWIMSVSRTNLRGQIKEFVGLENFKEVILSPEFYNSLIITLKFVFIVTTLSIVIGLILALLANNKLKGNRAFELVFSMPMAIASAPASIIWMMIFHPTNGILNGYVKQNGC